MANTDRPRGFWPIRHAHGGEIRTRTLDVDAANGSAMYRGDVAESESDGNLAVAAADKGIAVIGIFAGFIYTDAGGDVHYSDSMPATKTSFTSIKAFVWDDPYIVFGVQSDGTLAETDIYACRDHVAGTGNAKTNISGHELDATAGGEQCEIIGIVTRPDNAWGEFVDVEVMFNEHKRKAAVAGI